MCLYTPLVFECAKEKQVGRANKEDCKNIPVTSTFFAKREPNSRFDLNVESGDKTTNTTSDARSASHKTELVASRKSIMQQQ